MSPDVVLGSRVCPIDPDGPFGWASGEVIARWNLMALAWPVRMLKRHGIPAHASGLVPMVTVSNRYGRHEVAACQVRPCERT